MPRTRARLTTAALATAIGLAPAAVGVASASASAATIQSGGYTILGAIGDLWTAQGGASGWLGSPRSNEMPARGGVYQQFDGGTVYWSSATGAHAVHGAIFGAYAALGYEGSYLGLPVTNETATTGGVYQRFQGGTMYWSATTGSHPVWSGILSLYAAKGYERGSLGMPTTDEYRSSDGRTRQDFTGGSLYWGTTSTTASTASSGPTGVWAQLAQCESGGNPTTNTGNGFYGMYQFTLSTWRALGGTGLPSEASAAEQTRLAQKLQASAGWGQWPACAASLGLL